MPEPRRSEALRPVPSGDPQEARFRDAVVRSVQGALAKGKAVEVPGIGTLSAAAGGGGEEIAVPPSFAPEIAAKTGLSEEAVRRRIPEFFANLRRDLLASGRLTAAGLGTFEAKRERAQVEPHPTRGFRMVRPAKAEVRFVPLKEMTDAAGGKKIALTPSDDLMRDLQMGRSTTILLAVPEKDAFADTVEYYFRRAGWRTEIHTTPAAVESRFASDGAFLLLLDHGLPDAQGLCRRIKSRPATGLTPVLMMLDATETYERPKGLMVCGDEHIAQPFEVKKLLTLTDDEILRVSEEEALFRQQVRFQFPSTDEGLEEAADFAEQLFEGSGMGEEGAVALKAAFREAVGNACQHGSKFDAGMKIEVLYLLDQEKATIVVQDQGPGFDHEKYVQTGQGGDAVAAARKRHQEGRMGGLGIMLMLKCCDKVEYNHSGNAITLTKRLPKTSEPAASPQAAASHP